MQNGVKATGTVICYMYNRLMGALALATHPWNLKTMTSYILRSCKYSKLFARVCGARNTCTVYVRTLKFCLKRREKRKKFRLRFQRAQNKKWSNFLGVGGFAPPPLGKKNFCGRPWTDDWC